MNLIDAGDPVELAKIYAAEGADELVFWILVPRLREGRRCAIVEKVAKEIFIPLRLVESTKFV